MADYTFPYSSWAGKSAAPRLGLVVKRLGLIGAWEEDLPSGGVRQVDSSTQKVECQVADLFLFIYFLKLFLVFYPLLLKYSGECQKARQR